MLACLDHLTLRNMPHQVTAGKVALLVYARMFGPSGVAEHATPVYGRVALRVYLRF
jgi:hypothetical protein